MKLTIIPVDNITIINGAARKFDLSGFDLDPNYHAIQWDGTGGFIETKLGENIILENIEDFEAIVTAHESVIAEEAALRLAYEIDPLRKVEKLAAVRWQHETGGVEVEGVRFWTTRDSIPQWSRMVTNAKADPAFVVPAYKAMSGYVSGLTAPQILAADAAGEVHITKCFVAEMMVLNVLDDTPMEDIEAAFLAVYEDISL